MKRLVFELLVRVIIFGDVVCLVEFGYVWCVVIGRVNC